MSCFFKIEIGVSSLMTDLQSASVAYRMLCVWVGYTVHYLCVITLGVSVVISQEIVSSSIAGGCVLGPFHAEVHIYLISDNYVSSLKIT